MDLPLSAPYRWARGVQHRRRVVLVRLEDSEVVGWGEIAPPPDDTTPLQTWVDRANEATGSALDAAHPRVRCGITQAQLDVQAQQRRRPIAQLLHDEPHADVPVNTLITAPEPDTVRQIAAASALVGYEAIKLKIGTDHRNDLARARAVREGAPHAKLRLDANAAWSPDDAIQKMQDFSGFGIDYIEQPVAPEHEDTLRHLTARGPFDVAIDESATDAETIDRLLADGIGHVVIVKTQRVGGPDRAVECIQAAMRQGKRVVVTNSLETSIGVHHALHVAAGTTEPAGLATSSYLAKDVAPPPAIVAGRMKVPRRFGLGTAPEDL